MLDNDGKRIVELPSKEVRAVLASLTPVFTKFQVTVEKLQLSPLERRIYDSIYTDVKRKFDQLNANGLVGKNYTHILSMLMRYGYSPVLCEGAFNFLALPASGALCSILIWSSPRITMRLPLQMEL